MGDDEARPNLSFSFSVEIFVFEFKFVYIDLLEGRPTDADNVYFSEVAAAGFWVLFGKQISWNHNVFVIYWIIRSIGGAEEGGVEKIGVE